MLNTSYEAILYCMLYLRLQPDYDEFRKLIIDFHELSLLFTYLSLSIFIVIGIFAFVHNMARIVYFLNYIIQDMYCNLRVQITNSVNCMYPLLRMRFIGYNFIIIQSGHTRSYVYEYIRLFIFLLFISLIIMLFIGLFIPFK